MPPTPKSDHYATLGVGKDATEMQIKKAYRVLAMKWHPDKNPDNPDAKAKFQEISHAYSILSDPEKRKRYDQYGDAEDGDDMDINDFMEMFGAMFGAAMFGDADEDEINEMFMGMGPGFAHQFGGPGGRAGMGAFFDADDFDSEDEDEILEEFMMAHSEQIGKKRWKCTLDGKEFSTLNIMRAHFQKRYKDQALSWFEETQNGEGAFSMDDMMAAMELMMGTMDSIGGMGRGGGGGSRITDKGLKMGGKGKRRGPKMPPPPTRTKAAAPKPSTNSDKTAPAPVRSKGRISSGSSSDSDE